MHPLTLPALDEIEGELPKFSVVIPTLNCALTIAWTLSTLNAQTYPEIEVIVVDGGSIDRTLEVAQRTSDRPLRVYTIADDNPFEMYNRGISLAHGDYVSLLLPGDSYLSQDAFSMMAALIAENDRPELAYCGCLRRDPASDPEVVLRELDVAQLKRGRQPTSIQSCWYRIDALRHLGKLNPDYEIRGGLDLLCRFAKRPKLRAAHLQRVLVDHDRPYQFPGTLIRRAIETQQIIHSHFGWRMAAAWWIHQNHWQFLKWLWKSIRPKLWS